MIAAAVEPVVARVAARIADLVGAAVASRLDAELAKLAPRRTRGARPGRRPGRRAGRRPAGAELTRWVADRRARRVPTFVIELTGLDTKKKIVARYGADAVFEKGKPLPGLAKAAAEPPRAKPPTIRKRAAAA